MSIASFIPDLARASTDVTAIPGLAELWSETRGESRVCIAVLDGPVDLTHACFRGAKLTLRGSNAAAPSAAGRMSAHGTHVSSVIFGQPESSVTGVAPGCRGIVIPIFSDGQDKPTPQAELARAIALAVEEGAQVINISGGELSAPDQADRSLLEAIETCASRGILVIAAAGNDACQCLHVPAALPSVLAVGAADQQGLPLAMTNWGGAYQMQGIVAPGESIAGAVPGGAIALKTGTSFATPIVSGVVGLLLSLQLLRGGKPDPYAVREALLASAIPCRQDASVDCQRFLAGSLNISGAYELLFSGEGHMSNENIAGAVQVNPTNEAIIGGNGVIAAEGPAAEAPEAGVQCSGDTPEPVRSEPQSSPPPSTSNSGCHTGSSGRRGSTASSASSVAASEGCGCNGSQNGRQKVYALGVIGYDFGTEARRDSFKQLMPSVSPHEGEGLIPYVPGDPNAPDPKYPIFPANPYDARQMVNYLCGYPRPATPHPTEAGFARIDFDEDYEPPTSRHGGAFPPVTEMPDGYLRHPADLSEAAQLIWTLNIELTPVYAIRPSGNFSEIAYLRLVQALAGQVRPKSDAYYVSRVSIPGVLTGESVRLFSGQVVPVLLPQPRGMYAWQETMLIQSAMETIGKRIGVNVQELVSQTAEQKKKAKADVHQQESIERAERAQSALRNFLNKVYYELRNLGQTSAERALNYAATNAFQLTTIIEDEAASSTQLDTIEVERSPFCRMDSDCWDVKIRFFDPENVRRARTVHRYTVDVSDVFPVTVGDVRTWQDAI